MRTVLFLQILAVDHFLEPREDLIAGVDVLVVYALQFDGGFLLLLPGYLRALKILEYADQFGFLHIENNFLKRPTSLFYND